MCSFFRVLADKALVLYMLKSLVTTVLLFLSFQVFPETPITICSWNIKDFGKNKSDQEIEFIANTVKDFDVVAIQEVVAGYGGPQAVARLHDALSRKGIKWDYAISDPTSGSSYSRERYAFLWKSSKLKRVGDAWLEKKYHLEIDREPYLIRLSSKGKSFTLVSFHAISKSKQPEKEIKYLRFLPLIYRSHNLIFTGDFNLSQSHSVFSPLKALGYAPALKDQKTSIRQKCLSNDCLASEYDNFFFPKSQFDFHKAGIIPFYRSFRDIKEARLISDHVPIYSQFVLN